MWAQHLQDTWVLARAMAQEPARAKAPAPALQPAQALVPAMTPDTLVQHRQGIWVPPRLDTLELRRQGTWELAT